MDPYGRVTDETIREIFEAAKRQINCAAKLIKDLKEDEEPCVNQALYHFSMFMKLNIRISCQRFKIKYSDSDSIEALFHNAEQNLPSYILNMVEDLFFWHNSVQYEKGNIKTVDEAYDVGRIVERYFNEHTRRYCREMKDGSQKSPNNKAWIKPLSVFL